MSNPVRRTFENFVMENRGLTKKQMKELGEGRIFIATLVEGTLVDRISYLSQVKKEIKTRVEKQFPDFDVGFVTINTNPAPKNPFINASINLDNLTLSNNIDKILSSQSKITME